MTDTSPTHPLVTVLAHHTLQCANAISNSNYISTVFRSGPFDRVLPTIPVAVVYVYKGTVTEEPILLPRLKRALELLLDYYPHLTGRLQIDPGDGTYEISRLGTGAELLEAKCSEPLDYFSKEGRLSIQNLPNSSNALFAPYTPVLEDVCRGPLFTIQYTRFACGGVSLGVRLPHFACDADGFFVFMRHLAEIYRGLGKDDTPKLKDPPCILSYMSDLDEAKMKEEEKQEALEYKSPSYYLEPESQSNEGAATVDVASATPAELPPLPPPIVGRILRFSGSQLEALKAHATDPSGGWVSTFDALIALFYQSIYRARLEYQATSSSSSWFKMSPPDFLTPVNFRGPDKLNLGSTYFPNALFTPFTCLSHETLKDGPLWEVAKHLHDLTRSSNASNNGVPTETGVPSVENMKQTLRWIALQPDKSRIRHGFRYGPGSLMLSQWSKFDMYKEAEFVEGERPVLVSTPFTPISLLDGLGYFLPVGDADKGAIDVHLALYEPIWEFVEREEGLRRFSEGVWSDGTWSRL
ncbi:hypothetical protein VKT23_011531 [Stygiomarasmius scandens]|uniref:Uncharacterized protein n=1 Tax=Marasmiellus scandens TaxID=2682957 RepID=A0ABR1JB29_9AGAR